MDPSRFKGRSNQGVSARPMSPAASVPAPALARPAHGPKTVQIDIRLPRLKKPTLPRLQAPNLPTLPYAKIAATVAVLAVLTVAGSVGKGIINRPGKSTAAAVNDGLRPAAQALATPSFKPLVPSHAVQSAYDGQRDSFSYGDVLLGTGMTVSEQPMPGQSLQSIAHKLGANTEIETASGTAFTATDSHSSIQTVVFARDGVLCFIQGAVHTSADWKTYIDGLQKQGS